MRHISYLAIRTKHPLKTIFTKSCMIYRSQCACVYSCELVVEIQVASGRPVHIHIHTRTRINIKEIYLQVEWVNVIRYVQVIWKPCSPGVTRWRRVYRNLIDWANQILLLRKTLLLLLLILLLACAEYAVAVSILQFSFKNPKETSLEHFRSLASFSLSQCRTIRFRLGAFLNSLMCIIFLRAITLWKL